MQKALVVLVLAVDTVVVVLGGTIAINCNTLTKSGGALTTESHAGGGNGAQGGVGRIHIRGTQSGSPTVTPS